MCVRVRAGEVEAMQTGECEAVNAALKKRVGGQVVYAALKK